MMTGCPNPADDAQLGELYIRHRALPSQQSETEDENKPG